MIRSKIISFLIILVLSSTPASALEVESYNLSSSYASTVQFNPWTDSEYTNLTYTDEDQYLSKNHSAYGDGTCPNLNEPPRPSKKSSWTKWVCMFILLGLALIDLMYIFYNLKMSNPATELNNEINPLKTAKKGLNTLSPQDVILSNSWALQELTSEEGPDLWGIVKAKTTKVVSVVTGFPKYIFPLGSLPCLIYGLYSEITSGNDED